MDDTLVRYLLGSLPEEESQHLDERSIADDDFAERLKAIETDLIDAYVAGELTPDERIRFEAVYAAAAEGRARIDFARALSARTRTGRQSYRGYPALAAAAMVLLAIGGYWLIRPNRSPAPAAPAAHVQPATPSRAPTQSPSPSIGAPPPPSTTILSFVLAAPRRSAAGALVIAVPNGQGNVELRLEIEEDDFAEYDATLKDAAGVRTLWRSGRVKAEGPGSNRVVPIRVPANLLTPRPHVLELRGLPAAASPQILGSYPFRVVVQ
jgi:hypothetical protein